MKVFSVTHMAVGVSMLLAAGLSVWAKPSARMADARPALDLKQGVPTQFADWKEDPSVAPLAVSPDVQAQLEKIYSQTLTRTYINSKGQRVMLSIAYGGDQGRATQVHKPEVCYPMQGFQIVGMFHAVMQSMMGEIPIMRLVATQGPRVEPITYWITVGDTVVRGALEQNIARVKYSLTGTVPDGILVRVSTLSRDRDGAYQLHDQFVSDMLGGMRQEDAARLLGRFDA